ncbi:MAG TPA: hypothetical protein HPQ00_05300, partial [Magnetococcales bacterium]|nr:hypothetical protein [Magnetococcales bacterium]
MISLDLKNVTIAEVVDVACNLYDFTCSRSEIGFNISPQSIELRQFRLYYPNIYRHGTSTTQVSSGQKTSSTSTSSTDKGSTENKSETGSGFEVQTDYKADFWGELTNTLCSLLGLEAKEVSADSKKRNLSCQTDKKDEKASENNNPIAVPLGETLSGTDIPTASQPPEWAKQDVSKAISISPQTGMIMIRAYPSEIRQLKLLIDKMQANLLQQVVLEAKILEVTLSDHFQSGINWSFVSQLEGNKQIGANQTGGGTAFESPSLTNPSDMDAQLTQTMDGAMGVIPYSSMGGIFAVGLALNDFKSFLELLKGQGNVSVLSSPRIATLNNQK